MMLSLPPSMTGNKSLFLNTDHCPAGLVTVDATVDWRGRIFRTRVVTSDINTLIRGQSFTHDYSKLRRGARKGSVVARLSDRFLLFVDARTGHLRAWNGLGWPLKAVLWLEASARFVSASKRRPRQSAKKREPRA